MDNYKLVETFSEFKEFKNIDREAMMRIIEDVFRGMLNKKFETETDDFIDIIVNVDKGDFEIYHNRTVVEDDELTDPLREIKLSDAIKIEPDFEVGEEVNEELRIENFGRRDILALRQNLQTKVAEYEKENIFQKYKEKVGEIITAEVAHVWKREIVVIDDENIELILPKMEQIPADIYKKGDTIRAIVKSVESVNGSPVVTLSRTSEIFLQRLLEAEVPEIYDGLITIKKIVREPGQRAKVAVESYDDRIDPVGACVGMKGSRIHGIVRELRNENIDVINWTTNPQLLITRALSPAKITNIVLSSDNTMANVYMENDQISLAIGKGGYNIKLAGKLTGYEIDVYRNSEANSAEEDVDLQEFSDEIDQWVIDSLIKMGCDTAKNVLSYTPEEVASRADLEIETVKEVFRILKAEFEQDAE
ncbi:MAG: transcription termination factor NusA [bacterium]|jgi:N utilization substance protein A|nr:MAG: N utilization substance protein A [bacterium F082]KWW30119.1 MAG: N utilization substance protein A [bacterium P201]MBR6228024.1 transcription termination/antitermination protein NusA [Bacteroidales bacterium]MDO5316171.1 transcription termination factor NusA [bacterium]